MRILGVVAEYDPFHNGHAWQLAEARRLSGTDAVIVVMSTVFTQRGAPALLAPRVRARQAIRCGADAVIALPAQWALRSAEGFAEAGVRLLQRLGADAISFGAENADQDLLLRGAELLEHPPERFQEELKLSLSKGLPWPEAASLAAQVTESAVADLLREPNNTLGLCYLRAILRSGVPMDVYPVQRTGSYHDAACSQDASATGVRRALLNGCWSELRDAVPDASVLEQEAIRGHLHRPEALDRVLLARLRTMTDAEADALPDATEGIGRLLLAAARTSSTRSELLTAAKTRRYPYARLSRLAAYAMLGMTAEMQKELSPPGAILLGCRPDVPGLLSRLSSQIPLLTQGRELAADEPWLVVERQAWNLWALGASLPSGLLGSERMVTL